MLTKDKPVGDVVFGIDNAFATRAIDEGVLTGYAPTLPAGAAQYELPGDDADALTPVDTGAVCVNVDSAWFRKQGIAEPQGLDDLTKPAYKDLFVVPAASTRLARPGLPPRDHRPLRRRLGRVLEASSSPTAPRWSRAGPRPTWRTSPSPAATGRSWCPTTPPRPSPSTRRASGPRPGRCSTAASGRSSTPACCGARTPTPTARTR
ncbi:hypothetical protein G5V59_14820 [Nocardioides sp. W3-2-3]|uniref:ABC transporter substrate-binding protein n=1 Tax=Nocardioides convexus TaxID=2712224 RepID=UPI0024188A40|nr:ABC transporter substrate-binding protein [Nocardioides convexus]NHA00794.1 hypothetical protein [Nocardioides convexus]